MTTSTMPTQIESKQKLGKTFSEPSTNPPEDTKSVESDYKAELTKLRQVMSFEEYCANPPERSEWVDGQVIEKGDMGYLHSKLQLRIANLLLEFLQTHQLRGDIAVELSCRTNQQIRKPDVCYLSPEQMETYGQDDFTVLPEVFPLVVEVISPSDHLEEVFSKAREYLESGGLEVWLVLPRNKMIMIASRQELEENKNTIKIESYIADQSAVSPRVLNGFTIAINQFFN
jgi:Uma2 family endonuclease